MKKTFFYLATAIALTACTQNSETETLAEENSTTTVAARRSCPSEEIRQQLLSTDASARARYANIEAGLQSFITSGKVLADGSVDIPVVVNVLYKSSAENISDARIAEQIAILNADFAGTNTDATKIPTEFSGVKAGDTQVRFHLVKTVRKATTKTKWGTNDAMKKSSSGGIDATSPSNYFNLWVVGNMGGILGYATFPESAGLWNDGVVIAAPYFGKTGATAPYNLGRTATHEVGHYLNLRHIWGDASCGNDLVADTPTQTGANYGKPTYPLYNTCSGTSRSVMFMNYMDYVDDAAMFMFSAGQKARSQSVLTSSGARSGLRVY
ncbi:zinc metalloprotease [Epilithonimonas arachidiradicis]|uniref:Pregnancy-associated plasma protein-A n=1 Tax=Epilithonimonas arachidiradicis TaxID=1617282 RepID=A0A420DB75_9FLAO|nr:zinc metalloprotease [Epilithonimonas arachidiradicis]RKE88739.1 pregnancy-associated plasma protein-A [Epilithonimonas arachidiradicis]GGG55425.1 zinc metalloprotease [Epilithonimonas arachidiradicis]